MSNFHIKKLLIKLIDLTLDVTLIGNGKDSAPDIVLKGPGIVKEHARVVVNQGEVTLERLLGMILHNGQEVDKPVRLKHGDRFEHFSCL